MNSSRTPKKSRTKKTQKWERIIGIDIGDRWSHYCVLNQEGEVVEEGRFRTAEDSLRKQFSVIEPARIALEAGTHSLWMSEQLRQYGHEVLVAHPSELPTISRSDRKCDRVDAEKLAR